MGGCCGQERKPMFENGNYSSAKNIGAAAGNTDKFASKSANKYKSYVSRSNLNKFDTKKFQTNNNNTLKEAVDLNKALEKEDLIKIVHYFENNTVLIDTYEFAGTWAPSPETIGSLACGYLASFFMNPGDPENDDETDEDKEREEKKLKYSEILTKTDLCNAMKRNLNHEKSDRVELTVLLARILVEDNEIIQDYFVQKELLLDLVPFLSKKYRNPLQIATMETIDFLVSFREKESLKLLESEGITLLIEFLLDKNNSFEELRLGLQILDSLCTREEAKNQENEEEFKNKNIKILKKFKELNMLNVLSEIKENTSYVKTEEQLNDEDRKFCESYVKFLAKKINEV